ncbi:MAG: NTP transferase domain-containing protein [Bacteroidales bacterium]|nr:NTP transferase domain-containing protein [Bacteroidales bacterium]
MDNKFSTIILSSGFSERMGQPKALLKWDESTTFIEKLINEFIQAGSAKIVCMINERIEPFCKHLSFPSNVEFIVNHYPERGRFLSILTGVGALDESNYCFIHNVDNPFVTNELINDLLVHKESGKWCSPVYNGKGGHPVLLPKKVINKIAAVTDLDTTLRDILEQFPKISVTTNDDTILRNINTPEDYNLWFKLLE